MGIEPREFCSAVLCKGEYGKGRRAASLLCPWPKPRPGGKARAESREVALQS